MPVDLYVGGVEHAVLHLLYARFWHKVLFDLGHVSTPEPFQRLVNQGLILGEMEFHAFQGEAGQRISAADLARYRRGSHGQKGVRIFGIHKQTGEKIFGRRVQEDEVEKRAEGYVLKGPRPYPRGCPQLQDEQEPTRPRRQPRRDRPRLRR